MLSQLFGLFCLITAISTQSVISASYKYITNSNKRITFLTTNSGYKDKPTTVFITEGTKSRKYKWENTWRFPQDDSGAFSFHSDNGGPLTNLGLGTAGESEELGALPKYEIGIESAEKTRFTKNVNGNPVTIYRNNTPGFITDTVKVFWVSYKNGLISLGIGDAVGKNKFVEWEDTENPHTQIRNFSFWRNGETGTFTKIVSSPWQDDPSTYSAEAQYNAYEVWRDEWVLPELNKGAVVFNAKNTTSPEGVTTIQVGFAAEDATNQKDAYYDVIIGGWNNTQSGIRNKRMLMAKSNNDNAKVPTDEVAYPYWVMINNGTISFGSGTKPGSQEILSWKDPDAATVDIRKVSFSSYTNNVEYTGINLIPAVNNQTFTAIAPNNQFPEWRGAWKFPEANSGAVVFSAQNIDLKDGYTTLNIGLAASPGSAVPTHTIYFGGWKNTKSAIINDRLTVQSTSGDAGQVPADKEPHTYWVSVNGATISYGKGSTIGANMIGTYDDPSNAPLQYFSFSSFTNTVKYEITSITSYEVSLAQKVSNMATLSEIEKIAKLEDVVTQKRLNKVKFNDADYTSFIDALEELVNTRDLLDAAGLEKLQRVINIAYYDPDGFYNVPDRAEKLAALYKESSQSFDLSKQIDIYATELAEVLKLDPTDTKREQLFKRINSLGRSSDETLTPFIEALQSKLVNPLTLDSSGLTVTEKATVEPFINKVKALYLQENSITKRLEALNTTMANAPKESPTKWISEMEAIKTSITSTLGSPKEDKDAYAFELQKGALFHEAFTTEQASILKTSIEMSKYANSNGALVFAEQQTTLSNAVTSLTEEQKVIADRIKEYADLIASANYSILVFPALVNLLASDEAKTMDSESAEILDVKIISPLGVKATTDAQRAMIQEMKQSLAVVKEQSETFKYHFAKNKDEKDTNAQLIQ